VPFTPDLALSALRHFSIRYPGMIQDSRLPSGFNPSLLEDGRFGWVSEGYFGLDQGIVTLMIENHRSGMIWNLMRRCTYIGMGLRRAGFKGGWLS
jgi:hypothetical protein